MRDSPASTRPDASVEPASRWDLIVVGGGVTGAGVLREATRTGYRCLLLEQRDFAWGTSSRSSKLVHGGLRYLATGKLRLTRHALQERERLVEEAPWLVRRLPFYFPLYRGEFPPPWAAGGLFWLYDRLAGMDDHRRASPAELKDLFPGLDTAGVSALYRYTDAVTDDARLVLRLIQESAREGATVRNYCKVTELLRNAGDARSAARGDEASEGRVCGVRVKEEAGGRTVEYHARAVINATGAWADRYGKPPPGKLRVHPQRGSHLLLDAAEYPAPAAVFLRHPRDGRRLFVYPWLGRTVVGTTDLPHHEDLDTVACMTRQELEYLLEAARCVYGGNPPSPETVISTWSGVRPIITQGAVLSPSGASREHRVWSEPGLVSCSGGKLTTFHHMALDVLKAAAPWLGPAPRRSSGTERRLFAEAPEPGQALPALNPARAADLLGRYGMEAIPLARSAEASELEPIGAAGVSPAELRWSLKNEQVVHLDDLLLRRSRLGLLLPQGGMPWLGQLEALCADTVGWDHARWSFERERYRDVIASYYAVPAA